MIRSDFVRHALHPVEAIKKVIEGFKNHFRRKAEGRESALMLRRWADGRARDDERARYWSERHEASNEAAGKRAPRL